MSKKAETQFALLASAFSADEKMARQVCSLLANGHIDESMAKLMLGLVRDGHFKSIIDVQQRWAYPWYSYTYNNAPLIPSVTATIRAPRTLPQILCNTSLTAAAKELVGSAA